MNKAIILTKLIKNTLIVFSLLSISWNPIAYAYENAADPFLLQAFEGVWKMERSATTMLADKFDAQVDKGILRYEPPVKDAPIYLRESYEVGAIEYRKKKYSSNNTQWGSFPHLNPDSMRLLEISIPQTRYLLLSGEGENLFSATDWKRYRFLHVFDMGRGRNITNHYPLFAEAFLGERVLGRLPNSSVLNYARVVPATWDAANNISSYEVLLYDLDRNGISRTLDHEIPVSYKLEKNTEGPIWKLSPLSTTPVANELDRRGHYFTGARLSTEEYKARQLAAQQILEQEQLESKKRKSNRKVEKPVSQR